MSRKSWTSSTSVAACGEYIRSWVTSLNLTAHKLIDDEEICSSQKGILFYHFLPFPHMVPLPRLNQLTNLGLQNAVDVVRLDVEEEWARCPLSERVLPKVNVVIDVSMIAILVFKEPVASDAMLLS